MDARIITAAQHEILALIAQHGPITAEALYIDAAGIARMEVVSEALLNLAHRGWATARGLHWKITPAGAAVLEVAQ